MEILKRGMYSGNNILLIAEWNISEVKSQMDRRLPSGGRGVVLSGASWEPPVQQGAEPAGVQSGAGHALQMCGAHGWVPVAMLLSRGCCDSCHGVGLAVAPEGDICPGCCWSRRIGGSCTEAKRRTEQRTPKEHPRHPCSPIPKAWCPQAAQGIPRKLFEAILGQKASCLRRCPAMLHKCWNKGATGWEHRAIHLTDVASKSLLGFSYVSAAMQIISKNRDTIFFTEM